MKLHHLIREQFSNLKLKTQQKHYPRVLDTTLKDCLDYMFPGEGFIRFYMRELMRDVKKTEVTDIRTLFNNVVDPRNLMFHIRDNLWLAQHLSCYAERLAGDNQKIPLSTLENFVGSSLVFDRKRREFEKNMVKAYIGECLNYRVDDFYSKSVEKIIETSSTNYDKLFRARVVNAMNFLGVDARSIEEGLELNGDLWQDEVMGVTFANRYAHLGVTASQGETFQIPNDDIMQTKSAYHKYAKHRNLKESHLIPPEELNSDAREVYDNWMALRRYEYQQKHQDVIKKLNKANFKQTKLNTKEVRRITEFLAQNDKQNS